jgi:hypothetical protein
MMTQSMMVMEWQP